ncbi:MAG: type III pantothenate kinase [Tractidigestivibacter sp.]|jgi:type III pantothenate kinase|uniref:type III pantothenate kinase n=1 Tax=Tractidigestivibacter sp. TaxID=2847320 RepID=UPI003D92685A
MPSSNTQAHALPVLAVDVGNTSTNFGLFAAGAGEKDEPIGTWELTTPQRLTADEARMQATQVLRMLACDLKQGGSALPEIGAILSCVVPQLNDAWKAGLAAACKTRPSVVGPGLKTGLKMHYRDPAEIGPDRIADALAARATYGAPTVAVDFGTTMNIEVIDREGTFLGGIIAPGIMLGAQALHLAAARLPIVELREPKSVIGRSTREAMQSGLVFGEIERVDGLIDRVFDELGEKATVVLTGSLAAQMAPLLAHEAHVDQTLTLRGLHQLYARNM